MYLVSSGSFSVPGDNSDTGVLDGVGLWPGGKKCDGEPLLDPLPGAPVDQIETKLD